MITPPLQRDLMQSTPRDSASALDPAVSFWHVRGRKRRDGRKESYTRPQRGNHNKETNSSTKPTRRKADALSLSSPLFREYRFRKRAYKSFETKACCSSLSLGDSAQVRRKERKRRRGRRLREDVESKRCITASSG